MEPVTDPADASPETAADLLAQTVDDMVAERLRKFGFDPAAMQATPGASGPLLVDPNRLPAPTALLDVPEMEPFTVGLPLRFALYVRQRAEAHGTTPEQELGGMVRWFWQQDLWRQSSTMPSGLGQAAGSGLRR